MAINGYDVIYERLSKNNVVYTNLDVLVQSSDYVLGNGAPYILQLQYSTVLAVWIKGFQGAQLKV